MNANTRKIVSVIPPEHAFALEADVDELSMDLAPYTSKDLHALVETVMARAWARGFIYRARLAEKQIDALKGGAS